MPVEFFDSNVLLYLADRGTPKADRSESLMKKGGNISAQVLNECANVMRTKRKSSWSETRTFLDELQLLLNVWPVTIKTHQSGLRLAERYGFSIYDGFIVAAALEADCDTLWSEDMQDGLVIDNRLRIVNPFDAPA